MNSEVETDEVMAARRQLTYPTEVLLRVLPLERIFVQHAGWEEGLERLIRLMQLAGKTEMPQGLLITGPTGVGKTALVTRFREDHLPRLDLYTTGLSTIYVRADSSNRSGPLLLALLEPFGYPPMDNTAKTLHIRQRALRELIRLQKTRLIIIDEADRLCASQNKRGLAGLPATELLRDLMDQSQVGLVLIGSPDLERLGAVDQALMNRLSVQFKLDAFPPNATWLSVLAGFAEQPPVNLDLVKVHATAARLHIATEGRMRSLKRLLTEAALVAVQAGRSTVEAADLRKAYGLVTGSGNAPANPFN